MSSTWSVDLNVLLSLVALVGVAVGWWVSSWLDAQKQGSLFVYQKRHDYYDKQKNDFYAPLLCKVRVYADLYREFKKVVKYTHGKKFWEPGKVRTLRDMKLWSDWVEFAFLPLAEEITTLISKQASLIQARHPTTIGRGWVSKALLDWDSPRLTPCASFKELTKEERSNNLVAAIMELTQPFTNMPEDLLKLCSHMASMKLQVEVWKREDPDRKGKHIFNAQQLRDSSCDENYSFTVDEKTCHAMIIPIPYPINILNFCEERMAAIEMLLKESRDEMCSAAKPFRRLRRFFCFFCSAPPRRPGDLMSQPSGNDKMQQNQSNTPLV